MFVTFFKKACLGGDENLSRSTVENSIHARIVLITIDIKSYFVVYNPIVFTKNTRISFY